MTIYSSIFVETCDSPQRQLTMLGSGISAVSYSRDETNLTHAYVDTQVTILALQQIFSRFGKVNKIVMFDKGSGFQALVQMNDVYTAMNAHEAADMQVYYARPPSDKHDTKPLRKIQGRIFLTFHHFGMFLHADIYFAQDH